MLDACANTTDEDAVGQNGRHVPKELAILLDGIGLLETGAGYYLRLGDRRDQLAVRACLSGFTALMGLDPDRIASDAAWARKRLESNPKASLYSLLPYVSEVFRPKLGKIESDQLEWDGLERALEHETPPIARAAVVLLAFASVNGMRTEVAGVIERVLARGSETALVALRAFAQWLPADLSRITPNLSDAS